jgi:hypothetical protein
MTGTQRLTSMSIVSYFILGRKCNPWFKLCIFRWTGDRTTCRDDTELSGEHLFHTQLLERLLSAECLQELKAVAIHSKCSQMSSILHYFSTQQDLLVLGRERCGVDGDVKAPRRLAEPLHLNLRSSILGSAFRIAGVPASAVATEPYLSSPLTCIPSPSTLTPRPGRRRFGVGGDEPVPSVATWQKPTSVLSTVS